jgi:hypothetical protein
VALKKIILMEIFLQSLGGPTRGRLCFKAPD